MAMMKRTMALLLVLVTGLLLSPAFYATNPTSATNLKIDNGDIDYVNFGLYIEPFFKICDGDFLACTFYTRDGQPAKRNVILTRPMTIQYRANLSIAFPIFMNKTRTEEFRLNKGETKSRRDICISESYPCTFWWYDRLFTDPHTYHIN